MFTVFESCSGQTLPCCFRKTVTMVITGTTDRWLSTWQPWQRSVTSHRSTVWSVYGSSLISDEYRWPLTCAGDVWSSKEGRDDERHRSGWHHTEPWSLWPHPSWTHERTTSNDHTPNPRWVYAVRPDKRHRSCSLLIVRQVHNTPSTKWGTGHTSICGLT